MQRGNIIKNKILHYLNEMNINWTIDNNTICIFIGDNIHKICINTIEMNGANIRGQYFDMANININNLEWFKYENILMVKNPELKNNYINIYDN